jgi:hypothetical protein
VFSLVTFAQPILDSAESAGNYLGFSDGADGISGENNSSGIQSTQDSLATATPLPTVAVDPSACDPEKIMITSPLPNEEIRGVVEIKGIVNVDDFGAYIIELAKAEEALWLPIQAHRTLVTEEGVLMEWDSSLTPPGSYVLQLRVTTHDGEDYEPCRVPIRVGNP